MNEELRIVFEKFQNHFRYSPEFPLDVDFDKAKYAEELLRCIEDNFNYTIAKYGTIPKPWNPPKNGYHPDYID